MARGRRGISNNPKGINQFTKGGNTGKRPTPVRAATMKPKAMAAKPNYRAGYRIPASAMLKETKGDSTKELADWKKAKMSAAVERFRNG